MPVSVPMRVASSTQQAASGPGPALHHVVWPVALSLPLCVDGERVRVLACLWVVSSPVASLTMLAG